MKFIRVFNDVVSTETSYLSTEYIVRVTDFAHAIDNGNPNSIQSLVETIDSSYYSNEPAESLVSKLSRDGGYNG